MKFYNFASIFNLSFFPHYGDWEMCLQCNNVTVHTHTLVKYELDMFLTVMFFTFYMK